MKVTYFKNIKFYLFQMMYTVEILMSYRLRYRPVKRYRDRPSIINDRLRYRPLLIHSNQFHLFDSVTLISGNK
jgi:hypothetical protein